MLFSCSCYKHLVVVALVIEKVIREVDFNPLMDAMQLKFCTAFQLLQPHFNCTRKFLTSFLRSKTGS